MSSLIQKCLGLCFPKSGRSVYASPPTSPDEPVVCRPEGTDAAAVQRQLDRYRSVFAELQRTERFAGGFRWYFRRRDGLEAELSELARREHACCRFLELSVTRSASEVVWEARAGAGAASVLEEFSQLPERLRAEPRPGHDVASVKRAITAAGLAFSSDSE